MMHERESSASRSASSDAEASPEVLANRAHSAPATGAPQGAFSGRTPPPEGERVSGHSDNEGADLDADDSLEIVRATTKIRLAIWRLDKEQQQQIYRDLRLAQRTCPTGANALVRTLWRADGASLDELLSATGEMPSKGKDWPAPQLRSWGYHVVRAAAPELAASIASAISKQVSQKWRQERWEALVWQRRSPPHFRRTMPIPMRAQDYRIVSDEQGTWLQTALRSGHGHQLRIPLELRDEAQRTAAQQISAGEWVVGAGALQEDSKRPGRWYLRVAYKRRVPKAASGIDAALNRGIKWFLVGVTGDGDRWSYPGGDIVAYLKQIQRRRQSYQRCSLASGRSGRGRKHILRPLGPLQDKGERWRRTKCQTVARRFAAWLRDRGVARLFMEDLTGIRRGEPERLKGGERIWRMVQEWPYHQLQTRIISCCEEYGIEVKLVGPEYVSQTCPACGACSEGHRDLRRWMLRCSSCGYREHLDAAAARNVLARGQAAPSGAPNHSDALQKGGKRAKRAARKSPTKGTKRQRSGGGRRSR